MPDCILTGQSWSAWVPARQQWLLAKVIFHKADKATLKFDTCYGMRLGESERTVDVTDMLFNRNLYRFIEDQAAI
jgi:hypothetical protein